MSYRFSNNSDIAYVIFGHQGLIIEKDDCRKVIDIDCFFDGLLSPFSSCAESINLNYKFVLPSTIFPNQYRLNTWAGVTNSGLAKSVAPLKLPSKIRIIFKINRGPIS